MTVWSMLFIYAKKKIGFFKPMEYVTKAACIIGLFRNYKYFTKHREYVNEITVYSGI